MADRVERLTNLLALLLETSEPLSLVQIAAELDGQYPDGATARRGAFERDKSALREIGVPIEHEVVTGGEFAGQARYRIDRARYELADLDLDEDETRALQVAMAATRPGSATGQEALWKLGAGLVDASPGGGSVAAVVPDLPSLPILREAVSRRHPVGFRYRDVDRRVDPWGLLLRSGFWYLIGFDHGRADRRTFRIDRIDGDVTAIDDESFERPADFDPRDAFPADPKVMGDDAPGAEAIVRIDAGRAAFARREIGDDRVERELADGSIELRVACANPWAFRSWLLGYLDAAEVVAPDEVRADVVAWLEVSA